MTPTEDALMHARLPTALLALLALLFLCLRLWLRGHATGELSTVPAAGQDHDRIADEQLTALQREMLDALVQTSLGDEFGRDHCLRALLTCRFDDTSTVKLLRSTQAWRKKYTPDKLTVADLKNSLPSRCWVPGGVTKTGWPILECHVSRWKPFAYSNDENHRLIGFLFSRALKSHPTAERFCILFDMSGWSLALGMPQPMIKVLTLVSLAQNQFCERLGAVILVNVPAVFRGTWAVLKPLIHERVAPRVVLYGSEWRAAVSSLIDDDNLPETLGGRRKETPLLA